VEVKRKYEIYLDKLRLRKYVKIKAYNIECTVHREGLVAEGEKFYEMCIETELDKYLTLLFYYIGCSKNVINLYHMFNLTR
jgi:hypothetical protein